jgi:hypothetical protein
MTCFQASVKAGTAWKVISVIMPRAPREMSAARKRSGDSVGEHVSVLPLERVILRDKIESERMP